MRLSGILLAFLLAGCWPFAGFIHDEELDDPYHLVAVDARADMIVCRRIEMACVGDGLPADTVFAAGADERYVVTARHPRMGRFGPPDARITEYHYLVRTPDEAERGLPSENVRGPFSQSQFEREKERLGLPEFSVVFDDLK